MPTPAQNLHQQALPLALDPQALAITLESLVEKLERVYDNIYRERMHDVPIINETIGIHAIGFQAWEESYLGVMITPWFMNIMLLPSDSQDWSDLPELSKAAHVFPSGKYTFNVGFEPALGHYQSCSLFSPMFDFADDEAAIDTAEVVMKELMNIENVEQGDIDAGQIERIWNGEEQIEEENENLVEELAETEETQDTPSLSEKINKPVSRRNLLRGSFLRDKEK